MAKNKNQNDTNATATAPAKEKAKAGSSIPAQAKSLVVEVYTKLTDSLKEYSDLTMQDLLGEGITEHLTNLAGELISNAQRGLPLSVRLANVEAEIAAHWPKLIQNGKAMTPADAGYAAWEARSQSLLTKKNNLLRAQKRTEAEDSTEATTATA